jgi:hypothetical protein
VDIGNKKMAMGNIYTGIEPVSFPFDDDNWRKLNIEYVI